MQSPPFSPRARVPPAMDRWQRVAERVRDPEDRQDLALLARVVEADFHGRIEREKDLTGWMAARYRWGNKTTRRRAMRLPGGGGPRGGGGARAPPAEKGETRAPEGG